MIVSVFVVYNSIQIYRKKANKKIISKLQQEKYTEMSRKQTIIVFPHLNDCGGDLSKKWYVEWQYRIPGENKPRRERNYTDLNLPTANERYFAADIVIREKTEWLRSGLHLMGNPTKVFEDELLYRTEAKIYGNLRSTTSTVRTSLSEFMAFQKQKVNNKTFDTYVSKMRIFNQWMEKTRISELSLKNITRIHILEFAKTLSESGLSRLSIKKYIQIIHSFFDFQLELGKIDFNPAVKIPAMGKIVDMSPVPFHQDERKMLKEAIEPTDPQLWLSCEIQYYCAIRPGTEIRLMKISWIDFERGKFRIPSPESKSSRVDVVDIPSFLSAKIQFLKDYNKDFYVFGQYGRPGTKPVGKNTLRNRFNRYREALGISTDKKFYSWKHSGAIQLLDNGLKPYDLKEHLRHQSFATTEIYLKKRAGNLGGKINRFATEI
jgi:integrase